LQATSDEAYSEAGKQEKTGKGNFMFNIVLLLHFL
jgi:hypothetical protein